jgi:hypothetical protein
MAAATRAFTSGRSKTCGESMHPWLTMETTGSTALSPGNSPPTQISTHGEFNSPRGCRGTFGSVGTADATRIETDSTGIDYQLATFTGRVVLAKGQVSLSARDLASWSDHAYECPMNTAWRT